MSRKVWIGLGLVAALSVLVTAGTAITLLSVGQKRLATRQLSDLLVQGFLVDESAVKSLLDQGADVNTRTVDNSTVLMWALQFAQLPLIEELLRRGAAVNVAADDGSTPLMAAAEAMKAPSDTVVKMLIDRGADVNARRKDGWTALMLASRWENVETMRILLEAGADVNARSVLTEHPLSTPGQTALTIAREREHPEVARLLEQHGAK